MSGKSLWMVLLVAGLFDVLGAWPDQSCDNKEVKDMLRVLTNEVVQLKKEVQGLNEGQKVKAENEGGLKILSVSRKSVIGGKSRYTIQYEGPVNGTMPVQTLWNEYNDYTYTQLPEVFSNEISTLSSGVFETSVITSTRNDSHIMVTIGHNKHFVALFLYNDDAQEMMETDIEPPILNIIPKGDIVYYPGHNATVKIQTVIEKEGQYFSTRFVLYKPKLKTVIFKHNSEDDFFHIKEEIKYIDKVEQKVVFNTKRSSFSGIVFMHSGEEKKNELVKKIETHKEVVLRPITQDGPFPDGNIYYVDIPFQDKRNEEGENIRFCPYGEKCRYDCLFYGNDLSKLELFKTVNGIKTQENFDTYIGHEVSYSKLGQFEVSPTVSDPFPVTYTCVASNIEGQNLTSKLVVSFGFPVKFIENESSMELFDNGTARFVCTARGLPLPNLTIQCGKTEVQSDIVYASEDVIRVVATCDDVAPWSWPACTARNAFAQYSYLYETNTTHVISNDTVLPWY